eukprot:jgi/Mesvir1/19665/Mv09942-RA.1
MATCRAACDFSAEQPLPDWMEQGVDDTFTAESLPDEILDCMRERENSGMWRIEPGSVLDEHLEYRRDLVVFMIHLAERYHLQSSTTNLAVIYMDRVLSNTRVPESSLHLVAGCAILIASKFEEEEVAIPAPYQLLASMKDGHTVDHIRSMEQAMLMELGWKLSYDTSAHFLGIFMAEMLASCDPSLDAMTASEVAPYAAFFHSLTLQDYNFLTVYPPSLVASAILAATRHELEMCPLWPSSLETLTGYSLQTLLPCTQHVLELFAATESFRKHADMRQLMSPLSPMGAKPSPAEISPKSALDAWVVM